MWQHYISAWIKNIAEDLQSCVVKGISSLPGALKALREVWPWICFSGEVTCKDLGETVRDAKDPPTVSIARPQTCDFQREHPSSISHLITISRETLSRSLKLRYSTSLATDTRKVRTGCCVRAAKSGGYVLDSYRNQSFLCTPFQMSSHAPPLTPCPLPCCIFFFSISYTDNTICFRYLFSCGHQGRNFLLVRFIAGFPVYTLYWWVWAQDLLTTWTRRINIKVLSVLISEEEWTQVSGLNFLCIASPLPSCAKHVLYHWDVPILFRKNRSKYERY